MKRIKNGKPICIAPGFSVREPSSKWPRMSSAFWTSLVCDMRPRTQISRLLPFSRDWKHEDPEDCW